MRMTICLMLFRLALVFWASFDLISLAINPISVQLGEGG